MKKTRTFRDREENKRPLKKLKRTLNRPGKGLLEEQPTRYKHEYDQQWFDDV